LRAADRDAVLFDLGIGRRELRACIRVADAGALGVLRELAGRALFDRDAAALARIAALDPVRVFMSALGRIEVYRPIAPPGGTTERGPHTHLLPHLLAPARPPRRSRTAGALLPNAIPHTR